MTDSRIGILKQMSERDPNDSFTKYALGLEYMSQNDLESARDVFEELRISDPGYSATYYQLGKVYEGLGEVNLARKTYEQGIYVTTQQSDMHTRNELDQAIDELLQ